LYHIRIVLARRSRFRERETRDIAFRSHRVDAPLLSGLRFKGKLKFTYKPGSDRMTNHRITGRDKRRFAGAALLLIGALAGCSRSHPIQPTPSPTPAPAKLAGPAFPAVPVTPIGGGVLILKGHTKSVVTVAFSRDGGRVATGSMDRTAKLWDARTGRLLRTFPGHTLPITSAAFSPDGKRLITGSDDRSARIWNVATGRVERILKGHAGALRSVAFSPDGTFVLTGSYDGKAKVWDARTGKLRRTLEGHKGAINAVAISPDGKRLLTGSFDSTAKVWDTSSGVVLFTLTGHTEHVNSVAFAPDGSRMLTGSGDGTAKTWDSTTGREVVTFRGQHHFIVHTVSFFPDGAHILTMDTTAKFWDGATGRPLRDYGKMGMVTGLVFAPDGKRMAGGTENTATIWNTPAVL
jgi:WD40 repeat protein